MMTIPMQMKFRGLVAKAWDKEVATHNWKFAAPKIRNAAKDAWYRSKLLERFGVESTKQIDTYDHFAALCALFEEICGDSIYWQLRAMGGKVAEQRRRLIHEIKEVCDRHDLDENYARGIARQSLQSETTPLLDQLQPAQLLTVLKALKTHAKRQQEGAAQ